MTVCSASDNPQTIKRKRLSPLLLYDSCQLLSGDTDMLLKEKNLSHLEANQQVPFINPKRFGVGVDVFFLSLFSTNASTVICSSCELSIPWNCSYDLVNRQTRF